MTTEPPREPPGDAPDPPPRRKAVRQPRAGAPSDPRAAGDPAPLGGRLGAPDHGTPMISEWLRADGPESDVVASSRIRLARNFAGFKFVSRCSRQDRVEVLRLAQPCIASAAAPREVTWVDLSEATELERVVLVERHLISQQLAKGSEPRAVAITAPDERLSVMVNEEDHLRIQVIRAGLALDDAFEQINSVDDRIDAAADYAFSARWGYLTACPTNVGTGIRVSVMLHLPALKLTGEIEKVKRAAGAMNLAFRGFFGEGTEDMGDLCQLSNQTTLGKCERDILTEFEHGIIPRVIEYERMARRTLMEKRRIILDDQLHRARALLSSARLMKSGEAMQALSMVRLGACLGVFTDVTIARVHELMLLIQPGHLQRASGRPLDQAERRAERASLLRRSFGG